MDCGRGGKFGREGEKIQGEYEEVLRGIKCRCRERKKRRRRTVLNCEQNYKDNDKGIENIYRE